MRVKKALILPMNLKNQVFIQDRQGYKKPDWGFFGGSVEENETSLEAVIRESKEELCIDLKESDLVYLGESITDSDGKTIVRDFYLYATEQEYFDVREGNGGHWFTFDEAREKLDIKDRFDELLALIKLSQQK